MSIAIIRTGGKQFTVEPGSTVRVPSLKDEVGTSVDLEVLAVGGGKETKVGSPLVEGAKVTATIVDHGRAPSRAPGGGGTDVCRLGLHFDPGLSPQLGSTYLELSWCQ